MAWVLKGAESFLNTLDQSASQAMGSKNESAGSQPHAAQSQLMHQSLPADSRHFSSSSTASSVGGSSSSFMNLSATELAGSANMKRTSSESAMSSSPTSSQQSQVQRSRTPTAVPRFRKDDEDEKLFEFLNSPATPSQDRRKKNNGSASGRHSRQSSTSSNISTKSVRTESSSATNAGFVVIPHHQQEEHHESSEPASSDISPDDRSEPAETIAGPVQGDPQSQQLSSLELENKLLRQEVSSLNQEMTSALDRAKKSLSEVNQLKDELKRRQTQISNSDAVVRQLRLHEDDLNEELNAKNSQLAVLRVRLQEADQEIKAKQETIQSVQEEKQRILQGHSDSSGMHSHALDSIKEKLHESEAALKREQESYRVAQTEFMERQGKIEVEQRTLTESLSMAQKKYNDEKVHSRELSEQLRVAKNSAEEAKQELADYKQKATRILQSKDKLISSLKEGAEGLEGVSAVSYELEELRNERDMLREELQQANIKMDQLRTDLQELESMQQIETESLQDQLRDLEEQFSQSQQQLRETETDLTRKGEELRYTEDDAHKLRLELQGRLKERDDEIQRLRNQLKTKSVSSSSQSELEGRLHALTESLIQKQTMLETLSSEKNSLGHQLERLQRQYNEVQASTRLTPSHTVNLATYEDDEGARQRLPLFMQETPSDGGMTRNVKRAASTIDKFSIRLGVFLRRYPMARLFVICYMFLLHLWVMIVLLTYTPEVHGKDFKDIHPQAP
ncbi:golgin subfamily A member 5-like [Diadema setosum]|uniref:golgin subfamily A member 5-like n=1 Tax=Diadema setosum TaxID=31175 RepID=UPI003B3A777F